MPNAVAMETLDLCKLGHLEDGDPVELGAQMAALARRFPHINVWGGCCGTDGRHIGANHATGQRGPEGRGIFMTLAPGGELACHPGDEIKCL